jgi:hypothetical protein
LAAQTHGSKHWSNNAHVPTLHGCMKPAISTRQCVHTHPGNIIHCSYSSCYICHCIHVTLHATHKLLFMHTYSSCIQVALHATYKLLFMHTSYSLYYIQVTLHTTHKLLFMLHTCYSSCIYTLHAYNCSSCYTQVTSCIHALHAYNLLFILHMPLHTSNSSCYIQASLHATYKLLFMHTN